jgi:hypothetical protein
MNEFLRKVNLIDHLTTNLQMNRNDFVDKLSRITDEGGTGFFANPFEAFSSSENEFKGQVTYEGFELRRRATLFNNYNMAVASGTFTESNGQLTIETEIKGFHRFIIFFYVFYPSIYSGPCRAYVFNSVFYDEKKREEIKV